MTRRLEALASATKTWTPPDTNGPTVTESSEPPTVTAGNNVLQTFTVTNTSEGSLTNVSLAVTFPAGSTVISSSPVFDEALELAPGATLRMRHRLLFADAEWDAPRLAAAIASRPF